MAAARPQYAVGIKGGAQVKSISFDILCGAGVTAFVAGTLTKVIPERCQLIGARLTIGLKGGTFGTGGVDLQVGGVSVLTAPFDAAAAVAGTPIDKEIAAFSTAGKAAIAANSELTCVMTVSGGSSPTWANACVQLDYVSL